MLYLGAYTVLRRQGLRQEEVAAPLSRVLSSNRDVICQNRVSENKLNSMEELAFTDGGDFVRIAVELEEGASSGSFGDARVSVWVRSADFEAKNDLWVVHQEFAAFCKALVRLEESRKDEARLVSVSPGELDLFVRAISPLGAMAVGGVCGYPALRPHGAIFHSLQFGFEFDPSQLISAVATPWVRRHAV